MILVETCARSSLYTKEDGMLVRHFHDTDRWSDPFPPMFDERGCARCSGNRRIELLIEQERLYGDSSSSRHVPPYLQTALRILCKKRPSNIETFARALGVKPSTAWSYAYKVVERWPRAHEEVSRLVHPEIWDAVQQCENTSGSLKELYECIRIHFVRAKELTNIFAHIRLARACRFFQHD